MCSCTRLCITFGVDAGVHKSSQGKVEDDKQGQDALVNGKGIGVGFQQVTAPEKQSLRIRACIFLAKHTACLITFLSTMLTGLKVISSSCISKPTGQKFTSFLRLFSLQLKICHFQLVYTCEEALGSEIWWGRERSIKAAEIDPSATIVASVHFIGATVVVVVLVGSITATEFWQR